MKEELLELLKLAGKDRVTKPMDALDAMLRASRLIDQIKDTYSIPEDSFDLLDGEMRTCLVVAALTGIVAVAGEGIK